MKKSLLIVFLVILTLFISFRIKDDWQRYRLLTQEAKSLEQKKINLKNYQQRLQAFLEQGRQEELLEQEARLMFGLKKEGERVVMILPPKEIKNGGFATTTKETINVGFSGSKINQFLNKTKNSFYNLLHLLKEAIK